MAAGAPSAEANDVRLRVEYARSLAKQARGLHESDKCDDAVELCNQAIAMAPTCWQAYLERSRAHSSIFRFDPTNEGSRQQAVKDAKRAAFMCPSSWRCQVQKSRAIGADGDLEQGMVECDSAERLVEMDLDGETEVYARFSVHDQRGRLQLELAKQYREQQSRPEAEILSMLGESRASLDAALALKPREADTLNNRGVAYYEARNYDLAMEDFIAALAVEPTHDRALSNRALVHRLRRDLHAAHSSLSAALAHNPNSAITYNNLACVERDLGNQVKALTLFTRASEMDETYSQAADNRDRVMRELGHPIPIRPPADVDISRLGER